MNFCFPWCFCFLLNVLSLLRTIWENVFCWCSLMHDVWAIICHALFVMYHGRYPGSHQIIIMVRKSSIIRYTFGFLNVLCVVCNVWCVVGAQINLPMYDISKILYLLWYLLSRKLCHPTSCLLECQRLVNHNHYSHIFVVNACLNCTRKLSSSI